MSICRRDTHRGVLADPVEIRKDVGARSPAAAGAPAVVPIEAVSSFCALALVCQNAEVGVVNRIVALDDGPAGRADAMLEVRLPPFSQHRQLRPRLGCPCDPDAAVKPRSVFVDMDVEVEQLADGAGPPLDVGEFRVGLAHECVAARTVVIEPPPLEPIGERIKHCPAGSGVPRKAPSVVPLGREDCSAEPVRNAMKLECGVAFQEHRPAFGGLTIKPSLPMVDFAPVAVSEL